MQDSNYANALRSDSMSVEERIAEIGQILAQGLMRLRARQSSELSRQNGESSLDFIAHQSGHRNHLHGTGGTR